MQNSQSQDAYSVDELDNYNESAMSSASKAGAVKSHDCGSSIPLINEQISPDIGLVIPIQDSTLNWNNGEIEFFPSGPGDRHERSSAVSGVDAIVNHEG